MELDFFTGYHGSGKTFTANSLAEGIDAVVADTGPIIRAEFGNSGINDFSEWNRSMENELGSDYSDIIVINGLKRILATRKPKHLFVVGNRNINGIQYVRDNLEGNISKILFFERPFYVMKSGYESRTGKNLTDDEFAKILKDDEGRGLLGIKSYCEANSTMCSIIRSDKYDLDSINLAREAIKITRK